MAMYLLAMCATLTTSVFLLISPGEARQCYTCGSGETSKMPHCFRPPIDATFEGCIAGSGSCFGGYYKDIDFEGKLKYTRSGCTGDNVLEIACKFVQDKNKCEIPGISFTTKVCYEECEDDVCGDVPYDSTSPNPNEIGARDYGMKLTGMVENAGINGSAIYGVAILDGELHAIYKNMPVLKVFNASSLTFSRQYAIPGLMRPGDIKTAPWNGNDRLFIHDWTEGGMSKIMYITDGNGNIEGTWPNMEDDTGRLSLTKEMNFVEAFYNQKAIAEYNLTGQMIRKIPILGDQEFLDLLHALKLTDDLYMASHGDTEDALHRVCNVNSSGVLVKCFGGEKGSGVDQLNVPVYLQQFSNGDVLVADKYNGRIRLLSQDLEFKKDVITRAEGLRYPTKMLLDEESNKLYVSDNDRIDDINMKDGRVMVFSITISSSS